MNAWSQRARAGADAKRRMHALLPARFGAAGWDAVPGMRRAELAVAIVALNLSAPGGVSE